ncbi:GTPase ObgE [Fusobacterium gastrosuis]|uniref:GTPase ObgE n=1 Tax=Fusobacterium gastrosuis TaxID=1755100 RepID=UPI0025D4DF02|nr:GTPase ObgE [uncultured Fusobacterium sp.]MDD7409720.1 GTPase ObgE [Fusobacteriaceae bacterium]MDY5305732.1 GTPase ObgE [Fusobacterium gastrosuis]MDY5713435.1 GTPase ObgE [Fusobacterium gastrosuis]
MFIDEVIITVKAGNGGDGSAAFRREKSVQFGGPDGGDGGKGGDVIFIADPNINTLIDFKFKKMFKAQNGENGQKKQMYGKKGEDLIIKVPVGTQVRDFTSGKLILDLNEKGETRTLLKGGRGGYGNVHFKNSVRKAPKIAEKGGEGAEIKVKLELKLLADIALVGYPSVGKSSFINKVSAANSKVGSYHFTTLEPKLGVVRLEEGKSFVIADIPGLIEGAHEGIGLGDKFLRHIERCKLIYHIVDVAEIEGRDCIEDFEKINYELKKFSEKLATKKQIVIANKMDLVWDMEKFEKFKAYLAEKDIDLYPVSVILNEGLKEILYKSYEILGTIEREPLEEENDISSVLKELKIVKEDFEITRDEEDVIHVGGRIVDDVLAKYVIGMDDESLVNFLHIMRNLGMEDALIEFGVQDGDTVKIANVEFEYFE